MGIDNSQRGFALLIAVIFMSVMLAFSLALTSLGYKQVVLASSAVESQYAFYAADAALECILRLDQDQNGSLFAISTDPFWTFPTETVRCGGPNSLNIANGASYALLEKTSTRWVMYYRFILPSNRCADVYIYKYSTPVTVNGNPVYTFLFSQGYNVSCNDVQDNVPRLAARGLQAHY